jgi:hypothetical protein
MNVFAIPHYLLSGCRAGHRGYVGSICSGAQYKQKSAAPGVLSIMMWSAVGCVGVILGAGGGGGGGGESDGSGCRGGCGGGTWLSIYAMPASADLRHVVRIVHGDSWALITSPIGSVGDDVTSGSGVFVGGGRAIYAASLPPSRHLATF